MYKYTTQIFWYGLIIISLFFLQIWCANKMQLQLNEYTKLLEEKEWVENTNKKLLMEYCSLTNLTQMEEKFKQAGFVIPTLEDIIIIQSKPSISTQTPLLLIATQTQKEHFQSHQALAMAKER